MPRPRRPNFYLYFGLFLWTTTIVLVAAPIWPYVYYRLSPQTSEALASTIGNTVEVSPGTVAPPSGDSSQVKPESPLPSFDPTLPAEPGMIIEKIGVRGELHQGNNWQEILKKGLWLVPNFGTPEDNRLPIIVAAHRWGYLSWTNSFRVLNSFYNLPKLKVGDRVELVWNQRKYIYEIYASENGTKITDYSADLILYTCELWNSPTRIFKYARRTI